MIVEADCANGSNTVCNKTVTNSGKAAPEEGSKQNQNGIRYGVLPRRMMVIMSISCLIAVKNGQTNKGALTLRITPSIPIGGTCNC